MKVICNHVAASCTERCSHKNPHEPIVDDYPVDDEELGLKIVSGLCSEIPSPCEMLGGFPGGDCLCVPCEDERHKTTPVLPGLA